MSQDTKWADPQTHTSVQHSGFSLGGSVQHSTLLPAISSYTNKGISGPLMKRMSPLKLNLSTSGRLQERRRKTHQFDVRGEITNVATLIRFVGMVRSRDEAVETTTHCRHLSSCLLRQHSTVNNMQK